MIVLFVDLERVQNVYVTCKRLLIGQQQVKRDRDSAQFRNSEVLFTDNQPLLNVLYL